MPHSIPGATPKINTTIAGEQCSLFQKRKRGCSAADGKCAWVDLHQEKQRQCCGCSQCPHWHTAAISKDEVTLSQHQPGAVFLLLAPLFSSAWQFRIWDIIFLSCPRAIPMFQSVKLSDLRPPCPAGHLEKNKTCCSLTCKILWLTSELVTFSFSFRI